VTPAAAAAHFQQGVFAFGRTSNLAASARPSPPGELTIKNEGRSETLAFALVEGVSIIGVKLLDFDVVVGRQFRSSIGSRSRTECSQRGQNCSGRKQAASQHGDFLLWWSRD